MLKKQRGRLQVVVVVVFAILGLVAGLLAASFTARQERFEAKVTLAMLPGPDVPPDVSLGFWEVLNRGQATRTAALTLEDRRWPEAMSQATGIDASEFKLSAAAIPDTTLIEVRVETGSAWAVERGLNVVVTEGIDYAETVSGPFQLETVSIDYGPATSLDPTQLQQFIVFGIAGLLIGAGAGFMISGILQAWRNRPVRRAQRKRARAKTPGSGSGPAPVEGEQPTRPIPVGDTGQRNAHPSADRVSITRPPR